MKRPFILCLVSASILLFGNSERPAKEETGIVGIWVRVNDQLRIEVKEETKDQLHSFIVGEGTEKFPCDVSGLPIYKNIVKAGKNLWRCQFLVVTMGSCSTTYDEGMIKLTADEKMEITCPGFSKKVYWKGNPRYEGSKN
jgi:hypothetical protein